MVLRALILAAMVSGGGLAAAQDKVDFEKQVLPILVEHCAGCHGAEKAQAKMRLHTAAGLKEKWDADEHLVVPGDAEKSELYARLVLPADNKKRMPKNADPLPQEKIDIIAKWIKEGAVLTIAAAEPAAEPKPAAEEEKPQKEAAAEPEALKELPLPEVAAASEEAIAPLRAAGATVLPLYAESNLLQVSFPGRSESVGDAEVALLSGVKEQVYSLNLADAKVSPAALAPLAELKNLSALHLERSNVTDEALAHLAGLNQLQYLNLYGTGITDEGLQHLAGLKNLRKLYLWQTKASYDTAMGLEKDIPGLMVNLGYDHPVVVKMRLTKELELAKKQAEEAKAAEEKARQQHEGTKQALDAVNARVGEIEKQLKELGQPAPAAEAAPQAAEQPAADAAATAANPAEAKKQ